MARRKTIFAILAVVASALVTVAGVSPGDATSNLSEWAEWLGLSELAKVLAPAATDYWVQLGGILIIICSIAILVGPTINAWVMHFWLGPNKHQPTIEAKGLAVNFPNQCNDDNKQTPVKRSYAVFPRGQKFEERRSIHTFYIGVKNSHPDKAIRNVRVKLHSMTLPEHIVDEYLLIENSTEISTDLNAGESKYFKFIKGWDNSPAGLFDPRIVPPEEYRKIISNLDANVFSRAKVITENRQILLLRNAGYLLEIIIYGENEPSTEVTFEVNAKERIEVFLTQ